MKKLEDGKKITTWIEQAQWDELRRLEQRVGIPMAVAIRKALDEYLTKQRRKS
jgi:hypothetical protein